MTTQNYKTEWDLSVFYSSPSDPKIKAELKKYKSVIEKFEKKYSKANFLKNDSALEKALKNYEELFSIAASPKPLIYAYLLTNTNSGKAEYQALLASLANEFTNLINKIIFFELRISKLPKQLQSKFLKSKKLSKYKYFLENIFKRGAYTLSEAEEKIINLMTLPAKEMWTMGQEKAFTSLEIEHKGEHLPIGKALNMINAAPTEERRMLHDAIVAKIKSMAFFAESEINAVYTVKKITDELKGYKRPYSSTLLDYQNDEKTVIGMINTVAENYKISHKFSDIKSKLLGLEKLMYSDRAVNITGKKYDFSFEKTIEIIEESFKDLGSYYNETLQRMLRDGQIDVYPAKGKTTGGFCWPNLGLPTYILLNHNNELRSVLTLAHEMGHAYHSELSKGQPPIYEGHTISVAEVASTFFENFVFDKLLETADDEQKIILLHNRLNDEIATVFRQTAFFNFELELHNLIREKGAASNEEICAIVNKHMSAYLGPRFELKPDDGYLYVVVSQLRRYFYVYSYTYGSLISSTLHARCVKDKTYMKKVETFLKAGGSMSPYQMFKAIGIDTSDPKFFKEGLKAIEKKVDYLAELVEKRNK
ncbi:MAG: M3 family metallopeptidase [Patescibacteria group bacterium]